jgi:hypothetical protein
MRDEILVLALLLATSGWAQDRSALRAAENTCGPREAKFAVSRDQSQHPAPGPEAGKARVYLLGDASFGVDGQWVGSVQRTYSSISLDPGLHHVCARYSHWVPMYFLIIVPVKVTRYSLHSLEAKAGETYYLDGDFQPQVGYSFDLLQLDPDEGVRRVAASTYGTSRRK